MKKSIFYCLIILVTATNVIACQTPASAIPTSSTNTSQILTTPQQYYERGIELKDIQQSDLALLAFAKAIQLDPNYAEPYYELGKIRSHSNDWDKAIGSCNKAISLNPNYSEAYYIRGLAQLMKRQYDSAISDLNMSIDMPASKKELSELRKITDMVIPPGELILLHMQFAVGGGRDCRGNYMPYNNSIQIQLLVNPGDSGVEVDKIYLDPAIGAKTEISSPIRYFSSLGLQYLVTCVSSTSPLTSAPSCRIDYKARNSLLAYKKSNEISNAEIIVEPGELVCPTN